MTLTLMESLSKENIFTKNQINKLYEALAQDWVGVLPTDTIYGLSASVFSREAVERIYQLKKRSKNKPLIVLISSLDDLEIFGAKLDKLAENKLRQVWPGKVSVILEGHNPEFDYLYCGGDSLAFRMPDYKSIQEILKKTGPIVSTSANVEGQPFARDISEAQKYFGNKVDFYLDAGELDSQPSKVLRIKKGKVEKIR